MWSNQESETAKKGGKSSSASRPSLSSQEGSEVKPDSLTIPSISLPKGGGAIKGIGEKFAANPVTGTGSMSVPIATSPGRGGFGPQLALSYDSGAGNGPFGFGWHLALPSITRKTDKGLPQYQDATESDVFILSGVEDLVPVLKRNEDGTLSRDTQGNYLFEESVQSNYLIRYYQPRLEGLFARIERWTDRTSGEIYWRSISRDNITTLYGQTDQSRIEAPDQPNRVFSWLISASYDDKGNAIIYEYEPENDASLDLTRASERNRARTANRYVKRIKYGNRTSHLLQPELARLEWLFEVVFDYDEGHYHELAPDPTRLVAEQHRFIRASASVGAVSRWALRPDPFSSYRAGFEVRTYRRCHRVLMFHHFPELGDEPCLVRSTEFDYQDLDYALANPVEAELAYQGSTRFASFIRTVIQSGFVRDESQLVVEQEGIRYPTYLKKSLPPLQFEYSKAQIQDQLRELETGSLENLPVGLATSEYHWVDLDGEGVSGILTEQAGAWFYKANLGEGRFGPQQVVPTKPSLAALVSGRQQLLDLDGNGQLELVNFSGPVAGFYERTQDQDWEPFKNFRTLPNLDWDEPNLRFVDLDGDGHADVLITEQEVFTWYPSLAQEGFGPAQRVYQPWDEEQGPHLVIADGTNSIYLADMSGDGLADLVRIRNGEICYWPNLGYGRFGTKVTMDNAPWLDNPDQFDQRRIRVADIDGSGTTDLIYLGRDGVRLYFNQSGNGWTAPRRLSQFPPIDNLAGITTVDLLGNGTACLVWSSPLPGDTQQPLRYIDLMGGQKPHLLIKTASNLGAKTEISYAPSTKFYLADKLAGKPWKTRLPFPVHCVEKVTVTDSWRQTEMATTYSYHHGYFDGVEREFRGFGRVEQVDVESYGHFTSGNANSPYITADQKLYQPPVKTVTWFHTGAAFDRNRILLQFQEEYFPQWFENLRPGETDVLGGFRENELPEPELPGGGTDLTAEEWREALRACKGMALRQEVYELEVAAREDGPHTPVKLFSAATHNCQLQLLQPKATNRHGVFLVTESEAITYHYELDLRLARVHLDPRIAHTLNLTTDKYGNVLQSVAAVYPRIGEYDAAGASLSPTDVELIRGVQRERHLTYTEHRYTTNDITDENTHRLPVSCEVLTYELTGITPLSTYFTLEQLRGYRLSHEYQRDDRHLLPEVAEIPYQQLPNTEAAQKRCVEHVRMLFFKDDLSGPLPFRQLSRLGLVYETYTLAFTEELLRAILAEKLTGNVRDTLSNPTISGYLSGPTLAERFSGVTTDGEYWRCSGIVGFSDHAHDHFYLPVDYTDPFGNPTTLSYDPLFLYVQSSTDALSNTSQITRFDYRVLAPSEMKDQNDNLSEVFFDALGLAVASAVKGKGTEGDNLAAFDLSLANPTLADLNAFFNGPVYDEAQARRWLGSASARYVYYFGEVPGAGGLAGWGTLPACACGIVREEHTSHLVAAGGESPLQTAFEYSDGTGNVLVKKMQAEPEAAGGALRWIATGKTILNNKGKPVKQYEPYFSEGGHHFEEPRPIGVTPVMYYDAVGRLIRTEAPDGSYSRVEFSPWHVSTYDANDTVLEAGNEWYARKSAATASAEEQRAARLAAKSADTPALTLLDSLGREVVTIAHNRVPSNVPDLAGMSLLERPWLDENYLTFTKLDAEGKPLWIRDARHNLVMQYIFPPVANNLAPDPVSGFVPCYDIAGNLLFQHSMDGGDRWILNDAAGKPMLAWDLYKPVDEEGAALPERRIFSTSYDGLHRPIESRLTINNEAANLIERHTYGESMPVDEAKTHNLRGQLYQHYDQSGLITNVRFDFKGNLLEAQRKLAREYTAPVIDWSEGSPTAGLEDETYVHLTEYDALNRMKRQYNWHRLMPDSRVAVYEPNYNARGLLASEDLFIGATKQPDGYEGGERTPAIRAVSYNAKGQTERIQYGNRTATRYQYDPETFRLLQLRTTRPNEERPFPGYHSGLRDDGVLQQLNYTYDPVGNITEIYDEAYEPVFFRNQRVEPHSLYIYDALYRLIEATGRENATAVGAPQQFERSPEVVIFPVSGDPKALRNYTQKYFYDEVGNIRRMQHIVLRDGRIDTGGSWTRQYEYAADSNRLLRTWTGVRDTEAINYHYDSHGSMLNLNNVPEEYRLSWDYRDMIQTVNLGGGGRAYYNYDSTKERTRKVITDGEGNKRWERLYLGGMELYRSYGPEGVEKEIETHYLFAGERRMLIVEVVLPDNNPDPDVGVHFRYQYGNHLGSVCLELDNNSNIISYEEYHPYGTTAYHAINAAIRATAKRYRYTGKERDEETGLNYHSARYYALWLARWTSADPGWLIDGLNLFSFCRNSPVSRKEIDGKQSTPQSRSTNASLMQNAVRYGMSLNREGRRLLMNSISSHYGIPEGGFHDRASQLYTQAGNPRIYWLLDMLNRGQNANYAASNLNRANQYVPEIPPSLVLAIGAREHESGVATNTTQRENTYHQGGNDYLGSNMSRLGLPPEAMVGWRRAPDQWNPEVVVNRNVPPSDPWHRFAIVHPAEIPARDHLLATAAVARQHWNAFERFVREELGNARGNAVLSNLSSEARLVWMAYAYEAQGGTRLHRESGENISPTTVLMNLIASHGGTTTDIGVQTAFDYFRQHAEAQGREVNLNDILTDTKLNGVGYVRSSRLRAAEADFMQRLINSGNPQGLRRRVVIDGESSYSP